MYALNLDTDNRILSACTVLPIGTYDGMPIVDTLPEGDIIDYKYINNEYVYDPLPEPEPTPTEPTADEVLDVLLGIGGNANE